MRFITFKKEQICIFQIFAAIFHFKLCSFVERGRKNISCSRAQGTLATPQKMKKTNIIEPKILKKLAY